MRDQNADNARRRQLRADRTANGLCGTCGEPARNAKLCIDCREKAAAKRRAAIAKQRDERVAQGLGRRIPLSPEERERRRQVRNLRRQSRQCAACGDPLGDARSDSYCDRCRESKNANRRRLMRAERERRKSAGVCNQCGKNPSPGGKQCGECREYRRNWVDENIDLHRLYMVQYARRAKQMAIEIYGGKCQCCGEDRPVFLTIDHVSGGGRQHRLENNIGNLTLWLKARGWPDGYQVLCWNCNAAKYLTGGSCPHVVDDHSADIE